MPNSMAAKFSVGIPVTEEAIADHGRMIEEGVAPHNRSTLELLRLHDQFMDDKNKFVPTPLFGYTYPHVGLHLHTRLITAR